MFFLCVFYKEKLSKSSVINFIKKNLRRGRKKYLLLIFCCLATLPAGKVEQLLCAVQQLQISRRFPVHQYRMNFADFRQSFCLFPCVYRTYSEFYIKICSYFKKYIKCNSNYTFSVRSIKRNVKRVQKYHSILVPM